MVLFLYSSLANKVSVMDLPWTVFVCGSGEEEEVVYQESQVTEELVEEHLVRVVTRDVLDLIGESSLCVVSRTSYERGKQIVTRRINMWNFFFI